jgi:membrane protein
MATEARDRQQHGTDTGAPGADAGTPSDIPRSGWKQVLVRTKDEIKGDRVGLMAAGVAFYVMLALVPTLIAAVTIWGLVSDPQQIQQTVGGVSSQLPNGAADLLQQQMSRIAQNSSSALGWTLVASVAAALWSASSGTKGLMNAVNAAYDEDESRGFLEVRGTALALTVGLIFFGLIVLALIAVVPAILTSIGLGTTAETVIRWGRWPLLAAALIVGLAVIYRYAPDRDHPEWNWLSWGAGVAVVIWLVASAAFAWYVNSFGSYSETYGSLAGVIVLMLWLFLSSFAILIGAELNAEMEHQTGRDTTRGEPEPMGQRGAHVADTTPNDSNDER